MAHAIRVVNGKADMAYVGERPWHDLGQALTAGATINTWKKEAGMNFQVLTAPVEFAGPKGRGQFDRFVVTHRSDDGTPLGVVSDRYNVVQPGEVLEFFKSLAEERGYQLETAGVLFGGARYWALAKTPHEAMVARGDAVRQHLLLSSACDGSKPTEAKYVNTRVVCANTIAVADREGGTLRVRVSHATTFKPEAVKAELGLAEQSFKDFCDGAKTLAKRSVKRDEAVRFLVAVLGNPDKPLEEQVEKAPLVRDCFTAWDGGGFIGGDTGHTAWGLVNVVTEYVDHKRGQLLDRRLDNAWFNTDGGMTLKAKAFAEAMKMAA